MHVFRNPEIRKLGACYLCFLLAAVLGGYFIYAPITLYLLLVCGAGGGLFFIHTKKRYEEISRLNSLIDELLHNGGILNPNEYKEGELSILSSQISKMTIRLREQAELLTREKCYLSQSLADISHQLRTPLTSIHLIHSRLKREQPECIFLLNEADRQLSRMEWLITTLLKIAQLESGTISFREIPVNVKELMGEALSSFEILLELKQLSLVLDIPETNCFRGDFSWSLEAMGNLMKNCIEHTPSGGTISLSSTANAIYTELTVSDTGTGFSQDDLPHLFDRFYKGKHSGQDNIGIGLALTCMIIQMQNGTITAENRKEGGAAFHIRFYNEINS